MELTEKERLLLVEKKEEIRRLTEDIIELTSDIKNNTTEIKKRVTRILSLIGTIASYTNSKKVDMYALMMAATQIFYMLEMTPMLVKSTNTFLLLFCNIVNSIKFNFNKKDFKINIPKIDFSLSKL